MGKKIEYTNGELTIVWQPELCQHAGICVKMLPNVYHPKERPWVQIENATTEELIAQIGKCPSGALSYRLNKKENEAVSFFVLERHYIRTMITHREKNLTHFLVRSIQCPRQYKVRTNTITDRIKFLLRRN